MTKKALITWQVMRIDPRYFRPPEVESLLGDPTTAKGKLAWVPEFTAQEICAQRVAPDLGVAHVLLKAHGHDVPATLEG